MTFQTLMNGYKVFGNRKCVWSWRLARTWIRKSSNLLLHTLKYWKMYFSIPHLAGWALASPGSYLRGLPSHPHRLRPPTVALHTEHRAQCFEDIEFEEGLLGGVTSCLLLTPASQLTSSSLLGEASLVLLRDCIAGFLLSFFGNNSRGI